MTDSTKRALRTGLQVLIAVLTAIPAVVAGFPSTAVFAQVVVVAAGASKAINVLEDLGIFPAWLKVTPVPVAPEGDAAP